jgi:predicted  nucleic acid-binding Zn-ribbon protein
MFALFIAQPVFSQTTKTTDELKAIREEMSSLKEGQTAIQKDLQEIKKLLQARPAAQPQAAEFKEAIVNVEGAPSKGDKNAKLVLVEFSDYQ